MVGAFKQQHPFAILIASGGKEPSATHIPLEVEKRGEELYLTGHLARNNPQGAMFENEGETVLAIFQGAHAYVSSSWYGHPNVPTWNYMTLHAYGKARQVSSTEKIESMMQALLGKYEQGQERPVTWASIQPEKMAGMLAGITCFEIKVDRLEASYKLSQNRNEEDRQSILSHLDAGGEQEREVARAMRAVYQANANRIFTKTSR